MPNGAKSVHNPVVIREAKKLEIFLVVLKKAFFDPVLGGATNESNTPIPRRHSPDAAYLRCILGHVHEAVSFRNGLVLHSVV